jgi:hypothetical protein
MMAACQTTLGDAVAFQPAQTVPRRLDGIGEGSALAFASNP